MLHKKNRLSQTAILHWKHGETLNYKTTLLLHFTHVTVDGPGTAGSKS